MAAEKPPLPSYDQIAQYLKLGSGATGSGPVSTSSGGGAGNYPQIRTTMPESIMRHDISDEELEMLTETKRENLSDWKWSMAGAALAALPSTLESIWKAYFDTSPVPISGLHLVEILICGIGAVLFLALKIITAKRAAQGEDLKEKIRARTQRINNYQ